MFVLNVFVDEMTRYAKFVSEIASSNNIIHSLVSSGIAVVGQLQSNPISSQLI